jgi:signal transduction histidine kinase/CheY-like chemotaxis protein
MSIFVLSYPMSVDVTTLNKPATKPKFSLSANGFAIMAMLANAINCIFYFIEGMHQSAYAELVGIAVLSICVVLNLYRKFELSKSISLAIVNLQVMYLSSIQGVSGGAFLYLFPFILSLLFFQRLNSNRFEAAIPLIFTILNLAGVLLFSNYAVRIDNVPRQYIINHYYLNIFLSFILTIVFFIFAIAYLKGKEVKIIRAKKFRDNVFNTSAYAAIIINLDTEVIEDSNAAALSMFGFEQDAKSKFVTSDWTPLRKILYENINILSLKESNLKFWKGDLFIESNTLQKFYAQTNAVVFYYEKQRYCKISFLDITEQKQAALEIVKAKEVAEKALHVRSRFLSNMSHELRTPLNGIIGSANLIVEQNESLSNNEYFGIIRNASQHMLTLVNQVLDYSKLETDEFQLSSKPFSLYKVIDELVNSFKWEAESKGLKLVCNIDETIPKFIVGDQLRLLQVCINLLSNAIKFSNDGVVKMVIGLMEQKDTTVQLQFSVADNGIGISPDQQKIIFDSFVQADTETTRKYGGTGLGLSISKKLVEKMDGQLFVKQNIPKGSMFVFQLPFQLPTNIAQLEKELAEKEIQSLKGRKILLVEDNAINMMVAKKMLLKWGAAVTEATNGIIGWDLFSKNEYDILLIDLEMPEMDGKSLIKKIREVDATIPAIAFTAAAYDNIFDDLKAHGFSEFMPKPFVPQHLNYAIASLLKK